MLFAPAALRQYKKLSARTRALLKQTMDGRLVQEDPAKEDRNRFRLRRASTYADFELRVQEWRVFYRVQEFVVIVELIGKKEGNHLLIEGKEFAL
ncbi:MAG: type II toxin-antitoxin system RelE family toxin [Candidatus Binatia bacterium]